MKEPTFRTKVRAAGCKCKPGQFCGVCSALGAEAMGWKPTQPQLMALCAINDAMAFGRAHGVPRTMLARLVACGWTIQDARGVRLTPAGKAWLK